MNLIDKQNNRIILCCFGYDAFSFVLQIPHGISFQRSLFVRSKDKILLFLRILGILPSAILCARPSTIAVLPTPGSPIRHGLFFVLLQRICIRRFHLTFHVRSSDQASQAWLSLSDLYYTEAAYILPLHLPYHRHQRCFIIFILRTSEINSCSN